MALFRDISKNKIDFTKISEEPWHFRYVGIVHAKIMEENQWCFEEYHLYIKIILFSIHNV